MNNITVGILIKFSDAEILNCVIDSHKKGGIII